MRLKPLPKVLIIGAVVGAVGYGVNVYLEHRAAAQPPTVAAPVAEPLVSQVQPAPQAATAVAPAPEAHLSAPTPAPGTTDRGLSNLLK